MQSLSISSHCNAIFNQSPRECGDRKVQRSNGQLQHVMGSQHTHVLLIQLQFFRNFQVPIVGLVDHGRHHTLIKAMWFHHVLIYFFSFLMSFIIGAIDEAIHE